ncbi:MAG: hypothetical protein BET99_04490 [Marine Group III euryarchaeote CG-Epi2]|uniref:Uncharacterized protein n=1 Tax=Marine Group III euryarchaeote CG-Epi2 TaxID=1888996 RepID=A0A1J5TQB9_9ARCH|nr:MAG: hypothetical protein BET99_04490 [Marine Group III euryarchaeote CG-Epi2]
MNKIAIVTLLATILLSASASTAVEDSTFAVGESWAFGKEIDLMEEVSSEISELENNITDLMSGEEAEMVKNASGLELKSFDLDNQAILGFYYTGEVIDNFDNMIHMQTEQSLYSHTVLGTKFTSMFPAEGEHELRLNVKCEEEDYNEEEDDCENPQIKLLDNITGEPLVLEELDTEIGGSMHYVAKITQDTWWTQDTHELAKTQITIALAASGGVTIKNVPNITRNGVSILDSEDDGGEPEFECADGSNVIPFYWANDGYEDCNDGSDEPGNGYDFECDNGDTYPMDYVNDGIWHCENGEDEGEAEEGNSDPFSVCDENEEAKEATCYETIDIKLETAVFEMGAEASINLLFDFGDNPMNVMDLPLEENKYWEGQLDRLTVSGDIGGQIDIAKPQLSLCPDLDCDQLPEMQELYSELTNSIQELHDSEEFSITVDRDGDGLPDVITEWNDIFPMYIPETWMDQVFQEIADQIACEDDESAQEGEDCDETAEEEFEKLNLRIENNRFAFGPYALHEIEDFQPLPYAFETGEEESAKASDGTSYEGYQVLPTDRCSENNPNREDEDCDRDEDEDDDGNDDGTGVVPGSRAGEDESEDYDECEGDPFCDSEIIWFHNADTGHPAYINMDMPNLREDGYTIEMMPIDSAVAEAQVNANADTDNPEKTTLIDLSNDEIVEDSALPGFGIMAAGASLLFVSRKFRS